MVPQRTFRADLFHRLNVLAIHIPPLRERPRDLKPLIEHFLQKYQHLRPDSPLVTAPEFIEACTQLTLPGNARQLENLVRWVLVHKRDHTPLGLRDLPVDIWEELAAQGNGPSREPAPAHGEMHGEPPVPDTPGPDLRTALATLWHRKGWTLARALQHCERVLLEAALQKTEGNQSQAARMLGITPRSLYNKIHKYQLLVYSLIVYADWNVLLGEALQEALL
jgi:DNA-binding NtrC family response regulator